MEHGNYSHKVGIPAIHSQISHNREFLCEFQKRAGVDIGLLTGVGEAPIITCQHRRVLDHAAFFWVVALAISFETRRFPQPTGRPNTN